MPRYKNPPSLGEIIACKYENCSIKNIRSDEGAYCAARYLAFMIDKALQNKFCFT